VHHWIQNSAAPELSPETDETKIRHREMPVQTLLMSDWLEIMTTNRKYVYNDHTIQTIHCSPASLAALIIQISIQGVDSPRDQNKFCTLVSDSDVKLAL